MQSNFDQFEGIVRRARLFTDASADAEAQAHPFEIRNIHPDLPRIVRQLFDDGHYAQATFEALKFLDEEVQRVSGEADFGRSLMMRVFGSNPPKLPLNSGATRSEQDEQEGFKFIFAGAMQGIRNPRGHKTGVKDDPDVCLDHLSLVSMLLRRLEAANLR